MGGLLNWGNAFSPAQAPIPIGTPGQVLTVVGAGLQFQTPAASGGGLGITIPFSPAGGVIDPSISGFVAALGPTGTGRIDLTLSANTSFEGLPAGADGQQLFITIVSGNFSLTLLHLNGSTTQKQIRASNDMLYFLNDTAQLFYDAGLSQWVLVA